MRLGVTVVGTLIAVAMSQIAIASVVAEGEAVVAVAAGQDERALEWDIDVAGGIPSTDHITLAPVAVGFQGEFTVAVADLAASVTLTAALPADTALGSVGCLDDLTPATEIDPVVDGASFTFDVVPGRSYRCFPASLPIDIAGAAAAPADMTQAATHRAVPRSDSATTSAAAFSPGWPAVLVTLVVICGIALLLRPVRRAG
jgi:hypothetical protein